MSRFTRSLLKFKRIVRTKGSYGLSPLRIVAESAQPWPKTKNL